MRTPFLTAAMLPALLLGTVLAQTEPEIRDLEPRPVAATDDPVNKLVAASTIDGLVLAVTIDGTSIQLDSVTPARISRAAGQRGGKGSGDRVTVVGFAGGARVSEVNVPDAVLNVQEGVGLVRLTKRQVLLALPAPRALDTIEVSAPATGATARIDVRAAYAPYCKGDTTDPKLCPSRAGTDATR